MAGPHRVDPTRTPVYPTRRRPSVPAVRPRRATVPLPPPPPSGRARVPLVHRPATRPTPSPAFPGRPSPARGPRRRRRVVSLRPTREALGPGGVSFPHPGPVSPRSCESEVRVKSETKGLVEPVEWWKIGVKGADTYLPNLVQRFL